MAGLLVLEPIGGIAGDMFLAAALDLGVDRGALEAALRTLRVSGWRLEVGRRTEVVCLFDRAPMGQRAVSPVRSLHVFRAAAGSAR